MGLAAQVESKLDEHGKLAWIGVMVLGFIVFWPLGLAILGYMMWSGRMGCCGKRGPGRWHNTDGRRSSAGSGFWRGRDKAPSSGNSAFDEYREETLRRLQEEQEEFQDFLERLRHAKDKAEFDQFMTEQRRRKSGPGGPEAADGPAPA